MRNKGHAITPGEARRKLDDGEFGYAEALYVLHQMDPTTMTITDDGFLEVFPDAFGLAQQAISDCLKMDLDKTTRA